MDQSIEVTRMFTDEFQAATILTSESLKKWLREKRKGVKFYPEVVTRQFPSGPQKAEVLRTKRGILCVNPVPVGSEKMAFGEPYGYSVGHIPSGKLFSPFGFPSAQTVKALVVALEDCGEDLTDPLVLPPQVIITMTGLIRRVYQERLRP